MQRCSITSKTLVFERDHFLVLDEQLPPNRCERVFERECHSKIPINTHAIIHGTSGL